ncbi:hypothetical protein C8F01DRAFT_999880, partial [Mycena amicta]
TGLPMKAAENPHTKWSRPGTPLANTPSPEMVPIPFTFESFEKVVLPFGTLTQNLSKEQTDAIQADPDAYVAIIPFNAGKALYTAKPHLNRDVKDFLMSLKLQTAGQNLTLAMPRPHTPSRMKRDYDGPWPMILGGASSDLKEVILWFQTFTVSPDLTFSAIKFDTSVECWIIMTIGGDAVEDTDEAKKKVLGTLKQQLWGDTLFVNFVDCILAKKGIQRPKLRRVVEATNTFALTYVETDNQHGVKAPVYQLTAQPISDEPDNHRQWIGLVQNVAKKCIVNMQALEIEQCQIECVHCKSKMHPGHKCKQPKTPGWLGPIPDDEQQHEARIAHNPNGGRGRRMRAGGRGWTQVPFRGGHMGRGRGRRFGF